MFILYDLDNLDQDYLILLNKIYKISKVPLYSIMFYI
jgi:hypothetical protein